MPRSPLCTNRTRTGLRLRPHRRPQTQDTVCGQYSRPSYVSLANTRLRNETKVTGLSMVVTRYFSRRFEDSLLAFRILEGTSDPQAPVTNTESGPAADRSRSELRPIDRHPPASMSTDGAESNDLCELSLITGDDQRDHRARVARICRGILVFSASKTFFQTTPRSRPCTN